MLRGSSRFRRVARVARVARAAIAAVGLLGCGASPALRAAEDGNLPELKRAIEGEARRGELDADEARDIARTIAAAEAENAAGSVGADRIRELLPCAKEIAGSLERRAEVNDEVGAVAALGLLEEGLVSLEEIGPRALAAANARASGGAGGLEAAAAAAWRAVRARSLKEPGDGQERRRSMLDGDEGVRVAAIRAAVDAADPSDTDALIEAARVDPNPLARTLAVRALGAIGGERVVLALKDIWALADEPRRQVITTSWAAPGAIEAGGRRELLLVAETQKGTLSIAAAIALGRVGGAGSASAIGVLARAIEAGPTRDRIYAINVSPLHAQPIREAILKAQADTDEAVALAAIARRLETLGEGGAKPGTPERKAIVAKLLKIAASDSPLAMRARGSLARARVREVIPLLERQVTSKSVDAREAAGLSLARMGEGELPRAVVLVADPEPRVRTSVACAILNAPR
ncbi:MAG TPA: HEAT repeat domain-containing protein [Polyangiaceae bacterium]|nr:HEAT repeat domain-containing protein [Polyangiaceae bacterium]